MLVRGSDGFCRGLAEFRKTLGFRHAKRFEEVMGFAGASPSHSLDAHSFFLQDGSGDRGWCRLYGAVFLRSDGFCPEKAGTAPHFLESRLSLG